MRIDCSIERVPRTIVAICFERGVQNISPAVARSRSSADRAGAGGSYRRRMASAWPGAGHRRPCRTWARGLAVPRLAVGPWAHAASRAGYADLVMSRVVDNDETAVVEYAVLIKDCG